MASTQAAPSRQFEHPDAAHGKKKKPTPYVILPINAFYVFLAAGIAAAIFAPIQDCDETFNYWEPTHYLSHGYGLQTWEYSPDYAIRSWLYIGLHAIIGNLRRLLPHTDKIGEFYFVRYGVAMVCALCQTIFYQAIVLTLNGRIGFLFLLATVATPGNWHASAAYLPSSFAMYACMLGAAAFMNWRGGLKTSQGIFWFAFAGVLGWPFAAALCAPFIAEEVLLTFFNDKEALFETGWRFLRGVVGGILVVGADSVINLFFYKKVAIVSWNIVKYNIFSKAGGPELYGTEPWDFYLKNLTLNFNIWFILALLALPLFVMQKVISPTGQGFYTGLRTVVFVAPFYMWFAIFTAQPHKEERFMYPAYPFLALNAAISAHIILTTIGRTDAKTLIGKIPARLKLYFVTSVFLASVGVSLARVYGVYDAYAAPLKIYNAFRDDNPKNPPIGGPSDLVCLGKEWYRFPSSYFLSRNMHAKFVRSEFRGLLPGEFSEAKIGFGFWSGTWLPTSGLNDENREDLSKYVDLRACDFMIDTQFPERTEALPPNEPDYIADTENWEIVTCEKFLDAANTHLLARTLWVPDSSVIPEKYHRKWGRHCLLQKKKQKKT